MKNKKKNVVKFNIFKYLHTMTDENTYASNIATRLFLAVGFIVASVFR